MYQGVNGLINRLIRGESTNRDLLAVALDPEMLRNFLGGLTGGNPMASAAQLPPELLNEIDPEAPAWNLPQLPGGFAEDLSQLPGSGLVRSGTAEGTNDAAESGSFSGIAEAGHVNEGAPEREKVQRAQWRLTEAQWPQRPQRSKWPPRSERPPQSGRSKRPTRPGVSKLGYGFSPGINSKNEARIKSIIRRGINGSPWIRETHQYLIQAKKRISVTLDQGKGTHYWHNEKLINIEPSDVTLKYMGAKPSDLKSGKGFMVTMDNVHLDEWFVHEAFHAYQRYLNPAAMKGPFMIEGSAGFQANPYEARAVEATNIYRRNKGRQWQRLEYTKCVNVLRCSAKKVRPPHKPHNYRW